MVEWLEQASQWHEMYCHDLEVMSSSPDRAELGVRGTSVLRRTWTKKYKNIHLQKLLLKKLTTVTKAFVSELF